jgi:hypothetical protein
MRPGKDWELFDLAKRQHGLASYAQIERLGYTECAREHRFDRGEWIRELPEVVRLYWAEASWMQRVWAAVLWAPKGAVISHSTAAVLCGLAVVGSDVVEFSSASEVRRPTSWISPHCTSLHPDDCAEVGGIPTTSPARTLLDMAGRLEAREFSYVMTQALRQGVVSAASVRRTLSRVPKRGRKGSGLARGAFKKLADVRGHSRS